MTTNPEQETPMNSADLIAGTVNEWFQCLPTPTEQQRDRSTLILALVGEFSRIEWQRDQYAKKYEEQLAATRTLDDLRMREIGALNREVRRLHAALAHIAETSAATSRQFASEGAEVPARITRAVAAAAEQVLAEGSEP